MKKPLKKCSLCGLEAWEEKDLSYFAKDKTHSYGRKNLCEECRKVQRREHGLIANYGITTKQYNELLKRQNYKCAICGTKDPKHKGHFHVDHNHNTGEVRGLLCHGCNTALGLLGDNIQTILKAASYLTQRGSYG